jgi:hypothetical protein
VTEQTLQVIEAARRIVRGEVVVEFSRQDLAEAIVELAGGRPNRIDRWRVDLGDWTRAAGEAMCNYRIVACGRPYHEHPVVPGFEWLRRMCDGRLVKL